MGKKNDLGRAIIKDRFVNQRRKTRKDSSLHTTELDDGYDWNRLNLKSVTEQNTLDEFLSTAQLAGTEFIAEKSNVAIVTNVSGLTTAAEELNIRQTQDAYRKQLKIPRRPAWDSSTTPEELDKMERENFLEWRRSLAQLQEIEGIVMTPYERNLDFWRQLWRVIERSDVVVQIVDARNPLLFRCEDLEAYVTEVDASKINMVLLNKADYLTHEQRVFWASYFDSIGLVVAFWSATEENERLKHENDVEEEPGKDHQEMPEDVDSDTDEDVDEESQGSSDSDSDDEAGWETVEEEDYDAAAAESSPVSGQQEAADQRCNNALSQKKANVTTTVVKTTKRKTGKCAEGVSRVQIKNSPDVLNGPQLIEFLESLSVYESDDEELTTIGMVGYPNVGKSSTINALMRTKHVSVSATPGHTKHFQTLFLSSTLMLCDCPGLVMPSFVTTKADMVVNGILPVDQMRDYVPPVSLVCKNVRRDVLEATYGILLPQPSENENPDRFPTAYELLAAYATVRGFMTHKGIPDYQRAARCILKDYITGKLLHCVSPPGVEPIVFEPTQASFKSKKAPSVADKKNPNTGPNAATAASQQDAAFLSQIVPRVRSGGVGGVVGFTRTAGYAGHHLSSVNEPPVSVAVATAVGKSSKRHNNVNKKEKLRRITSHLDA